MHRRTFTLMKKQTWQSPTQGKNRVNSACKDILVYSLLPIPQENLVNVVLKEQRKHEKCLNSV